MSYYNNDNNNTNDDNKPSGMMKVSLNQKNPNSKKTIKRNRKFKYALIPLIAVIFISIIFGRLINTAENPDQSDLSDLPKLSGLSGLSNLSDISDLSDLLNNGNEINNGTNYYFIPDSKFYANWTIFDYIENIDDFDAHNPSYTNYGIKLYWHTVELFEDGTAAVKTSAKSNAAIYKWAKNAVSNISVVSVDSLDNLNIILVCAMKNIDNVDYIFVKCKDLDKMSSAEILGYYVFRRGRLKYMNPATTCGTGIYATMTYQNSAKECLLFRLTKRQYSRQT